MPENNTFLYNTDYNKLNNNEKKNYKEIKIYIKISKNEVISNITYKTDEEYKKLINQSNKDKYQEVIFYIYNENFITQNLIKEKFIKHDTPTITVNNKGKLTTTYNDRKKYSINKKEPKKEPIYYLSNVEEPNIKL